MKKTALLSEQFKDFVIVLLATLCVLLPVSPAFAPSVGVDSGVFMYSGWRILNGEMPYGDLWDHKPPIVYYINALGLAISNGSRWGVWILELLSLFIAVFLCYKLIKKHFGELAAILTTYVWLVNLFFIFQGGNQTEEWALPLQYGALILFLIGEDKENKSWIYLLIGILGGLAFMTKQTAIGIWLAIGTYLLVSIIKNKEKKAALKSLALMTLGVASVILVIFAYFYFKGAWNEFWEVAFAYNFIYSKTQAGSLLYRIKDFFNLKYISRHFIFSISILGIVSFIFSSKKGFNKQTRLLLILVSIDLVYETFLIHMTGNAFDHYFIHILPALSIFSGLTFSIWDDYFTRSSSVKISRPLIALVTMILLSYGVVRYYGSYMLTYQTYFDGGAIQYSEKHTQPDESVYVWSDVDLRVNFFAKRICPTRYMNTIPLIRKGYVTEEMVNSFLDDLIQARPVLIMDTHPRQQLFSFPIESETIDDKVSLLMSNYEVVDNIDGWTIYRLIQEHQ